jgi:hypothetical protein
MAVLVLRLGLAVVGAVLGVGVGLIGLTTSLRANPWFVQHGVEALGIYFGSCALLFAILGCVAPKGTVISTTALAGTGVLMLGVDHFAQTGLLQLVLSLEQHLCLVLRDAVEEKLPPAGSVVLQLHWQGWTMVGGWVVLAAVAAWVQYTYPKDRATLLLERQEHLFVQRFKKRALLERKYSDQWRSRTEEGARGGDGGGRAQHRQRGQQQQQQQRRQQRHRVAIYEGDSGSGHDDVELDPLTGSNSKGKYAMEYY